MHRRDAHVHGTAYLWLIAAHAQTWTKTARAYQPVRLSLLFHTSKIQIRPPPSLPPSIPPSLPLPVSLHACLLSGLSLLLPPVYPLFLPLPLSLVDTCARVLRMLIQSTTLQRHACPPPPPHPSNPSCAHARPLQTRAHHPSSIRHRSVSGGGAPGSRDVWHGLSQTTR